MENVTDALKIAAWVLVFVLALSISISAFGQAKIASDAIISYRDRENDFFYVEDSNASRTVGIETIIPSMYRAAKENYKIVFSDISLYSENGEYIKELDFARINIGSYNDRDLFIKCILYGKEEYQENKFSNIEFNEDGIYQTIADNTFKENLGEENFDNTDLNKTKKRIITYTKN